MPLQKYGVVWLILHKVGADDEPTVLVIGPNTKGFVNDLLRQLRMGEQRGIRRLGRQVKEGELLRVLRNKRLDAGIDEIIPLVNKLRREACHQLPRKYALAGAGREGPFPHEQTVLLRMIAKPHAVCDDLCPAILISRANILRTIIFIRVGVEKQLDLRLLVDQVIIAVFDDGENFLLIQKSGQFRGCFLRTVRFFGFGVQL